MRGGRRHVGRPASSHSARPPRGREEGVRRASLNQQIPSWSPGHLTNSPGPCGARHRLQLFRLVRGGVFDAAGRGWSALRHRARAGRGGGLLPRTSGHLGHRGRSPFGRVRGGCTTAGAGGAGTSQRTRGERNGGWRRGDRGVQEGIGASSTAAISAGRTIPRHRDLLRKACEVPPRGGAGAVGERTRILIRHAVGGLPPGEMTRAESFVWITAHLDRPRRDGRKSHGSALGASPRSARQIRNARGKAIEGAQGDDPDAGKDVTGADGTWRIGRVPTGGRPRLAAKAGIFRVADGPSRAGRELRWTRRLPRGVIKGRLVDAYDTANGPRTGVSRAGASAHPGAGVDEPWHWPEWGNAGPPAVGGTTTTSAGVRGGRQGRFTISPSIRRSCTYSASTHPEWSRVL